MTGFRRSGIHALPMRIVEMALYALILLALGCQRDGPTAPRTLVSTPTPPQGADLTGNLVWNRARADGAGRRLLPAR